MRRLLPLMRHQVKRAFHWLWAQEGTPGQRARGLAVGVFCGCYPFFGLQTVLSVAIASLVRGNPLLAAAGTLISNPLTYLPLYWFNYRLGCWILDPDDSFASLSTINRSNLWSQGWEFSQRILLGSSVVGALLATLLGLVSYQLFRQSAADRMHRAAETTQN